eukprot:TRINITY_DN11704_c0_g1_i1.p1 TRINITY_DN11704_c0_g1~~TRINITY_DN11704_c0_g1_i1.p1  ORF type:complete len:500 (-),score=100.76 TRINITY_DN11704_c0_g1_i1:451-1950(-)
MSQPEPIVDAAGMATITAPATTAGTSASQLPGMSSPLFLCFGEAMLRYIPAESADIATAKPGSIPPQVSCWKQSVGGAELNVAVALSRLGWKEPQWISVVPTGTLGDHLISKVSLALGGHAGLRLVQRVEGEVGIFHVWPAKRQLCYQRRNSAFGLMDPEWFSESFWMSAFGSKAEGGAIATTLHVLHVTGITPLISPPAKKAWSQALEAVGRFRTSLPSARDESIGSSRSQRLFVSLDLNHRPALGTLEELAAAVLPHVGVLDLLMLSLDVLPGLSEILGVSKALPKILVDPLGSIASEENAKQMDMATAETLKELQARLAAKLSPGGGSEHRVPALGICLKRQSRKRMLEVDSVTSAEDGNDRGPPVQHRWSLVCLPSDSLAQDSSSSTPVTNTQVVISTLATAIKHKPVEELGGGDAWVAGVIDGLALALGHRLGHPESECKDNPNLGPAWLEADWRAALRRGDQLAALAQEEVGDFSTVSRKQLDKALASDAGPA